MEPPKRFAFGGTRPSWSRVVLTDILRSKLNRAERVNVLDFQTGIGSYGHAESLVHRHPGDPNFARTRAWIGAAATSLTGGTSVAAAVRGDGLRAIPGLLPDAKADAVSLECVIVPIDEVEIA